ncbi:MAG: NADH-quinone oxidoreductase subunit NuoE [Alcaligenaceae bacterium]|uniref:NADH-quinone oxidoreductase subunit NuoE n=1 Tax=Paenalcaligenes hermetiae TaxID=1157987 RepID=A0ABP9M3L4_9BURK|nr:NADH-quinone oxidoreductase subunit NuoE [Paenalcaligenes sp.]NLJ62421.1 NADH-quinone oxidoreductase subunit NuoE [Alcaligenaceae bacterium]
MLLSEKAYQRIDKELAKFPPEQKRSAIMASLTIAQEEKGWVSTDIIEDIANYLGLPPVMVQEVATFYDMYHLQPVGKYTISVCTNLPCALRDGVKSGEYLKQKLGIDYGQTTEDGLFTIEECECMGSCGDSPVMLVNNHHMCVRMEPERIDAMLAALKDGESA